MSDLTHELETIIGDGHFKAPTHTTSGPCCMRPEAIQQVADSILAAGYRKPRTITTTEELDALPVGAVVIDDEPPIWMWTKSWESKHPRKDGTPLSKWTARGYDDADIETREVPLPAVVLWEPGDQA